MKQLKPIAVAISLALLASGCSDSKESVSAQTAAAEVTKA